MDVRELSDEALVDSVLFWRHGHRSRGFLESQIEREVATRKSEILRRLAANARPEQVTLAMCLEAVDGLIEAEMDSWRGRTDTSSRELYALASLSESCHECLPHLLPWPTPQQDGAG